MISTIDTTGELAAIYENGTFQLPRWEQYLDHILPHYKNTLIRDTNRTIKNSTLTFEQDYLPKLNQVWADARRRNEAIASFQTATEHLESRVLSVFGRAPNVRILLYLGLCNSAGRAVELDGTQYMLLGIEKIMECDWCSFPAMQGLVYHELGHLYQMQYGILARTCSGADFFLWQLFTKGIAMLFEQKLVQAPDFFHQDTGGWLRWCEENEEMIQQDFNRDLPTMSFRNQRYFGDWVRYQGRGDVGYYLGSRFAQWIHRRYLFDEMIRFDLAKVRDEWDTYLSQNK